TRRNRRLRGGVLLRRLRFRLLPPGEGHVAEFALLRRLLWRKGGIEDLEDRAAFRALDLLRRLALETILVVLVPRATARAFDDHGSASARLARTIAERPRGGNGLQCASHETNRIAGRLPHGGLPDHKIAHHTPARGCRRQRDDHRRRHAAARGA